MRRLGQQLLRALQNGFARRWMTEISVEEMARSTMVFSPHADDETLGCGGTLIKKRVIGGSVKIVFMTDCRSSHGHLMPPDRLAALRAQEAISAARVLGLDPSDVCFLGFPDSHLSEHEPAAVERVRELLSAFQPEDVFIPYQRDNAADHVATNRVISEALRRLSLPVTVYEYPVWFWHHWPWVRVLPRPEGLRVLRDTVSAGFRSHLLGDFRHYVSVGDVLDRKRAALERHASQMTQLLPDPRWKTLPDIAAGDFLDCFFQPREIFCCYRVEAEPQVKHFPAERVGLEQLPSDGGK